MKRLPYCHAALAALVLLALWLPAPPAAAHEVRPALLRLTETAPDEFLMLWRVPARGTATLALEPELPDTCRRHGLPERRQDGARAEERGAVSCTGGLAGAEIRIAGLAGLRTDTLVRVEYLNGAVETLRATPTAPSVRLEGRRSTGQVAATYLWLGVEHILLGIDHLLFVTALLLLVGGWRRIVGTVTAFTAGHSVTLAGAVLGVVSVPSALVECLIALSIVAVAADVVLRERGETTIAAERPWLIAAGFGLLHGFGFAGALRETGLPAEAVPAALLFFNIGVELGQILFIVALLMAARGVGGWATRASGWAWRSGVAHAIGIMAAYWAVERTAAMWA